MSRPKARISVANPVQVQFSALSEVLKGVFNKTGLAEAEGSHREGEAFPVIDIGGSARMGIPIQNEDLLTRPDKAGCCRQSADPGPDDNRIPGFGHTESIPHRFRMNKKFFMQSVSEIN